MTYYLSLETINDLMQALIRAGMATREVRQDLLAGIHPGYVSSLSERRNIQDQIRSDLHDMNGTTFLDKGEIPLQIWLTNAVHRLEISRRSEQDLFREVLKAVKAQAGLAQGERLSVYPGAPVIDRPVLTVAENMKSITGSYLQSLRRALKPRSLEEFMRKNRQPWPQIDAAPMEWWQAPIRTGRSTSTGAPVSFLDDSRKLAELSVRFDAVADAALHGELAAVSALAEEIAEQSAGLAVSEDPAKYRRRTLCEHIEKVLTLDRELDRITRSTT